MIKEALDQLVKLTHPPKNIMIANRDYAVKHDGSISLIDTPNLAPVSCRTLTGLIDLIKNNFEAISDNSTDSQHIVHVSSPTEVVIRQLVSDDYAKRAEVVKCQPFELEVKLNQYLDREAFLIMLLTCFASYGTTASVKSDLDYAIELISNVQAENVVLAEDDGMKQQLTIREGLATKGSVIVRPRLLLSPYRTFPEVEQPTSLFLLRFKSNDGGMPKAGLFEADGGKWKTDAIRNTGDFLKASLQIPVIS